MKEKWKKLTVVELQQSFAYDEFEKLNQISLSGDITDICQQQLDSVAAAYRSAFLAKGYEIDIRDGYLPQGYLMYALALARYFIATRFPNSKDIFLDEARYKLYEESQELLKDPYLGVVSPDYSDSPELSGLNTRQEDAAIKLPFLKYPPQYGKYGFPETYWNALSSAY